MLSLSGLPRPWWQLQASVPGESQKTQRCSERGEVGRSSCPVSKRAMTKINWQPQQTLDCQKVSGEPGLGKEAEGPDRDPYLCLSADPDPDHDPELLPCPLRMALDRDRDPQEEGRLLESGRLC
mmetsp:Transcript_18524/g.39637  ORF Transcript_18524/g.39637 Transcript_18524/m.39637 type:complete len:124 (-) Transcript_18524:1033-1404(-)